MKPAEMAWKDYLRVGFGRRLSVLGEKLNIPWLIYNPIHFQHFHEHALQNAVPVISSIRQIFPEAQSFLDVGAGSGAFAAEIHKSGLRVIACEHSAAGRKMAEKQGVTVYPFDLSCTPPVVLEGTFDLAYCFEVAEHLSEPMGAALVDFLVRSAPCVVFTAAHPGQGGTGHINEQSKSYWIDRFNERGMKFSADRTDALLIRFREEGVRASWFRENIAVFIRPT